MLRLAAAILLLGIAKAQPVSEAWHIYADPQRHFQFSYPDGFGKPSPGTDDGFGERLAAIRFSELSGGVRFGRITLGGEAVLFSEFPLIDLQAAGGLYDNIAFQIFTPDLAKVVRSALRPLTAASLCAALGAEKHLDPFDPRLAQLTQPQREAVTNIDRLNNAGPKVLRCEVAGDTVTFDKESKYDARSDPRHIYGAVRFLARPYSAFQLLRGGADPSSPALLQQITAVVNSWRRLDSQ